MILYIDLFYYIVFNTFTIFTDFIDFIYRLMNYEILYETVY